MVFCSFYRYCERGGGTSISYSATESSAATGPSVSWASALPSLRSVAAVYLIYDV